MPVKFCSWNVVDQLSEIYLKNDVANSYSYSYINFEDLEIGYWKLKFSWNLIEI